MRRVILKYIRLQQITKWKHHITEMGDKRTQDTGPYPGMTVVSVYNQGIQEQLFSLSAQVLVGHPPCRTVFQGPSSKFCPH